MTMKTLRPCACQSLVSRVVAGRPAKLSVSTEAAVLDLVSEVGELSKALLEANDYGRGRKRFQVVSKEFSDELGDVFFSLIQTVNAAGINLEKSLSQTLRKLEKRIKRNGHAGSDPSRRRG